MMAGRYLDYCFYFTDAKTSHWQSRVQVRPHPASVSALSHALWPLDFTACLTLWINVVIPLPGRRGNSVCPGVREEHERKQVLTGGLR